MSLRAAMAAVAEVAGEVDGITAWYPTFQPTVPEWPSVMALSGNGTTGIADVPATNYLHNHNVRLWLLYAPDSTDGTAAMAGLSEVLSPLIEHLYESWARTPRHPLLSWIRRLGPITYTTETGLAVGGSTFYGAEIIVAVQEDRRVAHP